MRTTTRGKLYFVGSAGIVAAFLIWFGVHQRDKNQAGATALPVEKLRAFSLTNAPSTPPAASWSNSQPSNPAQAQVIQRVGAQVLAKQSVNIGTNGGPVTGGFRGEKQAEAMRQLQLRVGGSLQVYLRPENSTPMQLKGRPLAKGVVSTGNAHARNESSAMTFLRDNAALMLLNNPDRELALAHRQADELGGEVLRFTQHYQGLVVWPAEIGVHLDAAGDVAMVDGAYIATPEHVTVQPALAAAEIAGKARDAVRAGTTAKVGTPELIIYAPMDRAAKLAWKMDVSASLSQAWWVVIDAQDGQTLTTISRVTANNVSGSGVDLLGVTRPLNVWQSGATYYMIDASKPMFNTATGEGYILIADAHGVNEDAALQNNSFVISDSPNSWSVPDAVSASYNLAQTYDYYQLRFSRSSFNGGGSNLNAIVRIGNYANASWNSELDLMLFGSTDRYAGSLDIVGHEVTHGVVSSIGSQGVLHYRDQPGALNESFADIFGEMIEARTRATNDWLIGSELSSIKRNMASPSSMLISGTARPYPDHMSEFIPPNDPFLNNFGGRDNGGVHFNSSIINHAFYLLAAGLPGAVGYNHAEQIFYRCLTVSMKPFSQFVDARLGCVAAAEALYGFGSQQVLKTMEAFDAIGLFAAPASTAQPSNVNAAVVAADSVMFLREHWYFDRDDLFRIETAQGDSSSGSSLVTSVKLSRPSVTGNGADMFFVGGDDSLCYLTTFGTDFNTLYSGLVHSIAVSPEMFSGLQMSFS